MDESDLIIQKFIDNNYAPMSDIPHNQVFYTENSASIIVWAEKNVVIEHYFLFPNQTTVMHTHPFENSLIFLFGDLIGHRQAPIGSSFEKYEPGKIYSRQLTDSDRYYKSSRMPIGINHGFTTGERGAVVFNIQIWPSNVENALSAAVEYYGPKMGPIHENLMKKFNK